MRRFFKRIRRPQIRLLWEPRGSAWITKRYLAVSLCEELDINLVVDPFVTPPSLGPINYWRLHGPGSARHSYSLPQLQTLKTMLQNGVDETGTTTYSLFNNIPRVLDAKRFIMLLAE